MTSGPIRILLIEDTAEDAELISEALREEKDIPFQLTHAPALAKGLAHLGGNPTDLVLLDLKLPDSEGIQTLVRVKACAPQVPIVVLTASDDTAAAIEAVQKGAEDYLVKGYVQVYPNLLSRAIRYAIERQRSEQEVRRAHSLTEQLLVSIPSILIRVSDNGNITYWNAVAASTFGIPSEQALHRSLESCGLKWDSAVIQKCIDECRGSNKPIVADDLPFRSAEGQEGFLGITVVPIKGDGSQHGPGVLIFGADVTTRKHAEAERARLQEQLLQAQKMETIGRFAGGIAHDFNNFLQVILGFAWLIRARHPEDQTLLNDLQEIVHAAESASGMVNQLLAFSRRKPIQAKIVDANEALQNLQRLLQQFVGEHIRVEMRLDASPMLVRIDPTGFEQMVMNLCANARDSMPERGSVEIATRRISPDAAFLDAHPQAKQVDYVRLSIKDTGTGMEAEVAKHLFEPFFTTKQTKGTGLGLAVVYGLVQQHEGCIDIETSVGRGTTFHLYFPYQVGQTPEALGQPNGKGQLAQEKKIFARVPSGVATVIARRRILVVDDDPAILRLCEQMLKTTYDVTTVPTGQAALRQLEQYPYDVLLSDLRMPNIDGITLLRQVGKFKNAPRLVAMTGSISNEIEQRLQTLTLQGLIHKPFTASGLLDVVGRSLS